MIDVLIASLIDAIKARNDLYTGNSDLQDVKDTSIRLDLALIKYIDSRIEENLNGRKRSKTPDKVSVCSIIALNSAPPPLEEVDLDDHNFVREWFVQYKHWYETKRKNLLSK